MERCRAVVQQSGSGQACLRRGQAAPGQQQRAVRAEEAGGEPMCGGRARQGLAHLELEGVANAGPLAQRVPRQDALLGAQIHIGLCFWFVSRVFQTAARHVRTPVWALYSYC